MQSAMKTRPRRVSTGEAQQSAGGGHCSGSLVLSGRGAQAEGCRSGFNQFAQPPQVDRHARGEAGGSLHPYEICSFTMQQDRVIFEAGSLAEVKGKNVTAFVPAVHVWLAERRVFEYRHACICTGPDLDVEESGALE